MTKPFRLGSAVSIVAVATILAGCAAPQNRAASASGFGGRANGEIGLATRALAALNSNDIPTAIALAERAVEKTTDDAGFRALLGNVYFAGGRFASAEAAYKDALAIYPAQPQVVLKLALVQIAQGRNADAIAFLDAGRAYLDASDYGLALALAGRPADAVTVLEPAARAEGADARVRQNLALAYAFAGDWTSARTVAAQDVPADQLDARIRDWVKLANPGRPSDQIAALIGVTPASADPGQPTRLALRKPATRQAQAAPAPLVPVAKAAPVIRAPQPQVTPVAMVPAAPAPALAIVVAETLQPAPAPAPIAAVVAAAAEVPAAIAAFIPTAQPRASKSAKLRRASAPAQAKATAFKRGSSSAVVQLGAYGSPQRVATAWNAAARRFAVVRGYTPMSARFDSSRGTVYRLSLKGFASDRDARLMCESLRKSGGSCFVRNVAGDAPVRIASR